MHKTIELCVRSSLRYLSVVGTVLFMTISCLTNAAAQTQTSPQNQIVSDVDRVYTDPHQKFSVLIPAGAEVLEPEGAINLAMRSRSGWNISIQSSSANQSLKLEQMAGHFESKYIGADKPWAQKLSSKFLNNYSYSGQYEGSGSRMQMTIIRTSKWDYVLIFMAPDATFIGSTAVFKRVLSSFKPMNTDTLQATDADTDGQQAAITTGLSSEEFKRFSEPLSGYAISYPDQWIVSKPDKFTTVFSGQSGSDAGYVAVSIRNVKSFGNVPSQGIADGMLQQLKAQMAYTDAKIFHEHSIPISIGHGEQAIQGKQMLSTFRRGDVDYRQWSIVVPRPDGKIVHVWTYIAPLDRFHNYQDIAEKMAGSLSLISVSAQ